MVSMYDLICLCYQESCPRQECAHFLFKCFHARIRRVGPGRYHEIVARSDSCQHAARHLTEPALHTITRHRVAHPAAY
jgi:hypothetical protein